MRVSLTDSEVPFIPGSQARFIYIYTRFPVGPKTSSQDAAAKVGFAFLLDASGNLFKPKAPHLKDVECNSEAVYAVMQVSKGVGRYSAHILKAAIIKFYAENKLFPVGLSQGMEVIDTWGLRQGNALQRLVTYIKWFQGWGRRVRVSWKVHN